MGSALTWLMASVHTERQTRQEEAVYPGRCMVKGGLASAAICFAVVLARGSLLQPILKALFVLTFQGKKKTKTLLFFPAVRKPPGLNRASGNSFKPVIVQELSKSASATNYK